MNTATEKIRQATPADLSRIAEILVFDKRITCGPLRKTQGPLPFMRPMGFSRLEKRHSKREPQNTW